ncbi:MAG: hypothetical protein ACD_12C00365G0001 [uncultured bacterium]|nr:MAG: hypothetical protein ACD_12C00365G0001 [uncultured bacterium]
MSVKTAYSSSDFVTIPMATPATACFNGTPASINDKDEPETLPMDEDPFSERISETTRIAYGKSSVEGSTGSMAFSANAP